MCHAGWAVTYTSSRKFSSGRRVYAGALASLGPIEIAKRVGIKGSPFSPPLGLLDQRRLTIEQPNERQGGVWHFKPGGKHSGLSFSRWFAQVAQNLSSGAGGQAPWRLDEARHQGELRPRQQRRPSNGGQTRALWRSSWAMSAQRRLPQTTQQSEAVAPSEKKNDVLHAVGQNAYLILE